jgi:iron(III) transport system ATP-binding protein
MLLKVDNLKLSYEKWEVLKSLSFEMQEGEILCVLGESGCGKTSLLKAIRGFMDRDDGEIYFQDKRVFNKSEKLVPGTLGVAIVHQDFQLEPGFTVYDNIRHHLIQYEKSYQYRKTEEVIKLCKLEAISNKTSKELSGGQKQKVALAKAIIEEPPLLLLDEPFSNLDNISKGEFKQILKHVVRELNIGLLFVTHDSRDALTFSDQVLIIQNGILLKKESPEKLVTAPISKYAAQLLGLVNLIEGKLIANYCKEDITKDSLYWIPYGNIKLNNGNEFSITETLFLGNEFCYLLTNNQCTIEYKCLKPLTDRSFNISIKEPILIQT